MKRPQPDIADFYLQSFINNVGSVRKLKRLWGTTYVGGVEVLKERQYYHPASARDANFEKLFKFLGAYQDVINSSTKGIDSAWLYINKNKGADLSVEYNDFVASNLNQMWWDYSDGDLPEELTLTTTIVIEALLNSSRTTTVDTTPLLNPSWPEEQLITVIKDNYETLWDTCLISQQGVGVINKGSIISETVQAKIPDEDDLSPDDPWLQTLSRYALKSNGPSCTIKNVEIGYGKTELGRLYPTYVVTIEIPYNTFSNQALLVEDIVRDLTDTYSSKTRTKLSYPNGYYTKQAIQGMDSTDLNTDPDIITRPYRLWEDESSEVSSLYSNLWVKAGDKWYLKAAPFDKPRDYGLTFKQLNSYVVQLIDSGYKKKKVKWWKKAIAIVIFVVAIVLALPSGGASLTLTAVATAILAGALVLTLLTLAFSVAGADEWASAFAAVNKMIEPLVIVATIITMTAAIQKAGQEAAKKAAVELGKEAAEVTLAESIEYAIRSSVDNLIEQVIKGATDVMSGTISNASLRFLDGMAKIIMTPSQLRLEDINSRNKDLKAQYDDMVKEMSQEYDVLKGFMYIYSKPATADWSMYAATFDQPYERGGGPLHIGNIQRTTKQALRKADYSDSVFDNILVV